MINPPNLTKLTTLTTLCVFLVSLPKFAQSSLPSDTPVWLSHIATQTKQNHSATNVLDKNVNAVTGVSYDISEEKTSTNLKLVGYTDKFALAFKPNATLSIKNKLNNLYTNIYVDNKNHHLIVTKDHDIDIKKIELFNVLGELLNTWKIDGHADSYLLELKPRLPAGDYLTTITTNKGANNKKIIIK